MSLPQVFHNAGREIRLVMIEDNPWWIAADVCDILELKNTAMAVKGLDDDERGISNVYTPSGNQEMTIINESGLYSLILRSRKAEAKAFKKWITSEVLPAIRKTGSYQKPVTELSRMDLARMVIAAEEEKAALVARIEADAPKVEFANKFSVTHNLLKMKEFAKSAGIPGLGPNNIFKEMDRLKIIYRHGNHWLPYQKYIERGYFEVRQSTWQHREEVEITPVIQITAKGQQWLYNLLQTKRDDKALVMFPPKERAS